MAAGVVDRDEGPVREAGQYAGLVTETVGGDSVRVGAEHLDGHFTAQHLVDSTEDIRRTTGSYGPVEPVPAVQ
ncbi:hypothetical protein A6A28_32585 [Streptomyces sp. CB03578]|nr:hypothetical protein A6A28_32585 [Streptomyces sp. CB03578]